MLKNYFKTGLRNISKHKLFSFLNIIGLSIGMSVTLLIIVVLENASNFDDFQKNKESIYRVYTEETNPDGKMSWAITFPELTNQLELNESIEKITKINSSFRGALDYKAKELNFNGYFADSNFFNVFSYEFISGNPKTALMDPYKIILSEETAHKIFGNKDPFGETLNTKFGDFTVSGVIKEPDGNSHLSFGVLGSYSTLSTLRNKNLLNKEEWNWEAKNPEYIYLVIDNKNDISIVRDQLSIIAKQIEPLVEDVTLSFDLQNMDDIVLGKQMAGSIGPTFAFLESMIFLSLTLMILLPACFNYINLSIARSLGRGKEIGIRKILGGNKKQLVLQFIIETFILSLFALIGSMLIVYLIKDEFITLLASGSRLQIIDISFTGYLLGILLALVTALLAGIIPAVYFSKQNPLESLASKVKPGTFGALSLRKGLVVIQFALSIGFLIGISAFVKQYSHALNFEMGFPKENILVTHLADVNFNIFNNEFQSQPGVKSVSFSSTIPGSWDNSTTVVRHLDSDDSLEVQEISVDEKFLEEFDINLIKGNGFNSEMSGNNGFAIVNQQFEKSFGRFNSNSDNKNYFITESGRTAKIIGVVEDFNKTPLQKESKPILIWFNPDKYRYAFVTLESDNVYDLRNKLKKVWAGLSSMNFEAKFLEHYLEEAYNSFENAIKVLGLQGVFVMVISCLGLLGMVVFSTNNRIKEIGIRKVLGASEGKLIWLLSKSFLSLLLISTAIGVPISYFIFDRMLSRMRYEYVGIGLFEILASVSILFIAGGSVILWQTKKIASINPVENLRSE
ncbi:MAG: ABC transporter permease [Melioribacteraceae bacterium]|nr:ABC transporter permease [Melioribacteraceae bacterium]MCF8263715.1 ABC transporter permease [Melioribacteraceae bacterium]MCF8414095.1 ABC transporter permease [Melioribacteraceae bacterium]MCF8432048.1 ABC transporter permease [Melioribacteraceae bacterium]